MRIGLMDGNYRLERIGVEGDARAAAPDGRRWMVERSAPEGAWIPGVTVTVPIVFHEELSPRPRATGTDAAAIDLGFPCHLACVGCARRPPNPAAYHAARRRLTSRAATCATGVLRAVFFGGDAFALPRSFTALLDEIGEACARRGTRFEGTV